MIKHFEYFTFQTNRIHFGICLLERAEIDKNAAACVAKQIYVVSIVWIDAAYFMSSNGN